METCLTPAIIPRMVETSPAAETPAPEPEWNDISAMYRFVLNLPFESVQLLACGKRPEGWCPVVTALHVRIAREITTVKGSAAEINARAYGSLEQKVSAKGDGFTVNVGLVRE